MKTFAAHGLDRAFEGHKGGRDPLAARTMTTSRLLKFFAALSLLSMATALWLWKTTAAPPPRWLVGLSIGAFFIALLASIVDKETRPRMMLRFLAALFALLALISLAADVSRVAVAGKSFVSISLLEHLQAFGPSFLAALEKSIDKSLGPLIWDPVLLSVLRLPATFFFAALAIIAGIAGRPRRRVRIFVNDY